SLWAWSLTASCAFSSGVLLGRPGAKFTWGTCAKAGTVSNTNAAATLRIFIGISPWARLLRRLAGVYHGRHRTGSVSKPVRLGGFRGLHPIVPDRSAFGATIERKPDGDDARNQYQPTQHERAPIPFNAAIMGFKSGIFKPNRAWDIPRRPGAGRIPFRRMPPTMRGQQYRDRAGNHIHATAGARGVRHRGSK